MTKLLGISGALRAGSTNTKLLREAARVFGASDFTLADINMPLFDADLEDASGAPKEAEVLHDQIIAADAVVISTPEYNKSIPGGLKNALDWISRIKPAPFADKPVAIMSAAAGRAGGERAQYALRHCLTPFGPRILQLPEMMVAASGSAFDDNGHLTDERSIQTLAKQMTALKNLINQS